jgi:hypothetical protein
MEGGRWCWIWGTRASKSNSPVDGAGFMQIGKEIFEQQRRPRFGNKNPERIRLELWEWMIQGGGNLPAPGRPDSSTTRWTFEEGKLQGAQTAYTVRQLFNAELDCASGPTWTFDRMGATQTTRADGRIVCIGGEHEDFYDPDFCIYNDVVVLGPAGAVEIYGYPKDVFPPTDFHTSTLIANEIIVIGCVGYQDERRYGYTPVYRLDLGDYHMTEVVSAADMPGWISKHTARLASDGTIVVSGGEVILNKDGREVYRLNVEEFALELSSGSWRRLTNRNWRQFAIRMEKRRMFDIEHWPAPKKLLPDGVEYSLLECDSLLGASILVRGVRVAISVGVSEIKVLVEGELPREFADRLVESVRAHAETAIGDGCSMEEL